MTKASKRARDGTTSHNNKINNKALTDAMFWQRIETKEAWSDGWHRQTIWWIEGKRRVETERRDIGAIGFPHVERKCKVEKITWMKQKNEQNANYLGAVVSISGERQLEYAKKGLDAQRMPYTTMTDTNEPMRMLCHKRGPFQSNKNGNNNVHSTVALNASLMATIWCVLFIGSPFLWSVCLSFRSKSLALVWSAKL